MEPFLTKLGLITLKAKKWSLQLPLVGLGCLCASVSCPALTCCSPCLHQEEHVSDDVSQ